jgi:mannosyltransferase
VNQFTASLWGDEAFSAILSQKSIVGIVSTIIKDTSPPLYNLTEHLWFGIFGNSEIAIRALSFTYYLLATFFVYKIGEYLWNKKTGIVAAILSFLNPFFFIYAFEGRMYSLLALTVTASMYFFLKRKRVLYVIATTLALYTHHFAIFAVFIQAGWFVKEFFFGKRREAVKILKSFLAIGILYLPWIIPLYKQASMIGGGFWLSRPTLKDLVNLIWRYLAAGITHPLTKTAAIITLITLSVRNWFKDKEKSIFLLSWFLGPILLTFIVSQKFTSIFYDRYLLYVIPAAALLISSNLRKITWPLVGALIILLSIIDINYFTHPTKKPFREFANYVLSVKKGDDYLINWNSAAHHLWETKYYKIPGPIYNPTGSLPYYVGTALMDKGDIIEKLPSGKEAAKLNRIGVITSGPIEEVSLPGYTKLDDHTVGALKIIWFTKR